MMEEVVRWWCSENDEVLGDFILGSHLEHTNFDGPAKHPGRCKGLELRL